MRHYSVYMMITFLYLFIFISLLFVFIDLAYLMHTYLTLFKFPGVNCTLR